MKNKVRILSGIFIVLNCIITYLIASNRWVDRMPSGHGGYGFMPAIDVEYSFIEDLYDLFLGRGLPTVIIPLITVVILFVLNELIMKQEIKLKKYIYLFFIMFILNIVVYRAGIGIAV